MAGTIKGNNNNSSNNNNNNSNKAICHIILGQFRLSRAHKHNPVTRIYHLFWSRSLQQGDTHMHGTFCHCMYYTYITKVHGF